MVCLPSIIVGCVKWSALKLRPTTKAEKKIQNTICLKVSEKLIKRYQAKTQKRRESKEMRPTFETAFALQVFTDSQEAAEKLV